MIHARQALLSEGWQRDVRVEIGGGHITGVQTNGSGGLSGAGHAERHSHAFQHGFWGLKERRCLGRESFWTWGDMMYRFALSISHQEMQVRAEMAYIEMLEAAFTRVGEFHHLHRAPDGAPYANPAELSHRIFAAAEGIGIALTHLPVFYTHGGFGPQPAGAGQRRFPHDTDGFVDLIAACDARRSRSQDRVGYAPHSLRAASVEELRLLVHAPPDRVAHIHVAEQVQEVEDCLAATILSHGCWATCPSTCAGA